MTESIIESTELLLSQTCFIRDMKPGLRVNTSLGKGTIENVIEDIHCSVNVLVDGVGSRNIMLHTYTDKGLKINLGYE